MPAVKSLRAPRKTAASSAAKSAASPAAQSAATAAAAAPSAVVSAAIAHVASTAKRAVVAKAPLATAASKPTPRVAARAPAKVAVTVKATPRAPVVVTAASAQAAPLAQAKPKNKLVRDSFTIPKSEYIVLENLKLRAANLKRPTKKSEVLRAGVAMLQAMGDKAFLAALNAVPSLKTGRPKGTDTASPTAANANKSR